MENREYSRQAAEFLGGLLPRYAEHPTHGIREVKPGLYDLGDGNFETGRIIARTLMGASTHIEPAELSICGIPTPAIRVVTSDPMQTILSQAACWEVKGSDDYSTFASGPIRASLGSDKYCKAFDYADDGKETVVYCESGQPPEDAIATMCAPMERRLNNGLVILFCRAKRRPNTVQVLARGVETALKRLIDLQDPDFDPLWVNEASCIVPDCPPPADDWAGICAPNDMILYGATVTLRTSGDPDVLARVVPQAVSSVSEHYGKPAADIFAAGFGETGFDFSKVADAFAPARLVVFNVWDGKTQTIVAGAPNDEHILRAFGVDGKVWTPEQ